MENKNAEQPAYPHSGYKYAQGGRPEGLTKREYFAGLAMQGILAANLQVEYGDNGKTRPQMMHEIIDESIQLADTLLSQLNKTL